MTSSEDSSVVWFITGCSTGLGRALAEAVLEAGMRAAVTARDPHSVADLAERYGTRALLLKLDVARADDIRATVTKTLSTFGQIDVLVNNAGYGYMSAVEEGDDEEVRALFDTNFFGAVTLIKTVLPAMRARRRGHILNITSVRGHAGNGGSGYYSATKFALEGLTESLRLEAAEFGIHVTAVAPGSFRTDWAGRSLQRTRNSIADYSFSGEKHHAEIAKRVGKQPGDPDRAARAMIEMIRSAQPPAHFVLGRAGLKLVREKIRSLSEELDAWEDRAQETDFPS
jgi:NAD(P)-dependent dehydrogenase (short-subunit alcohol dehydrogenase family)